MDAPNVRRLLRAARLCEELGHGDDIPAALDEMKRLRAENDALKRDLQYARDGLTKGRTRMREDNERLFKALRGLVELESDGKHADECAIEAWEQARALLGPNVGVKAAGTPVGP